MTPPIPYSILPALHISGINSPVVLYKGPLEFSGTTEIPITGEGSVRWEWQPTTGLRFEAEVSDVGILFQAESVTVGLPDQHGVRTFITNAEGLRSGTVSGHLDDFLIGADEAVEYIIFHIPNFINYFGSIIQDKVADGIRLRRGHLSLEVDNWCIQIDSLSSTEDTIKKLSREGGFGITHVGKVSRIDGQSFILDQTHDLLEALGFFLSFARGLWAQPCLIRGYRKTVGEDTTPDPVLTKAPNVRLDSWAPRQTWFDKFIANELPVLFRTFWKRWSNPSSQDVLRQVIGWYLEANGGTTALQSRLILAQVALEMMAYEVLTDAQGNEPRGSASSVITHMLNKYNIPISIPSEMPKLQALATSPTLKDNPADPDLSGPGVTVAIRNALVHSKRAKRQKRVALTTAHYVNAWQLTLWHLELVLLAWMGYDQKYSCRWKHGWQGEHDPVPWAMTPASQSQGGIPVAQ